MDHKDFQFNNKRLHFWYHARLIFLKTLLSLVYSSFNKNRKILDIGCGTGTELDILKSFGSVTALDKNTQALKTIKNQNVDILQINIENKNLGTHLYDTICCFDVMEHINNDEKAIKNIFNSMKTGGYLFLTVPAFKTIFGPHDIALEHVRRYNKKEIKNKILVAGFEIYKIGYWNFLLFPLEALYRIFKKILAKFINIKNQSENKTPPIIINDLLFLLLNIDNFFIKKNIHPPFGLSLYCIAKKPDSSIF